MSTDPDDEPCPDDIEPASPGLLTFDYDAALAEGWAIGQTTPHPDGTPTVRIIPISTDEAGPRFRTRDEARRHVAERAARGSPFHLEAMSLVDKYERFVMTVLVGKATV